MKAYIFATLAHQIVVVNPDGSVRITKTPKITGKGQTYFINQFLGSVS